MYRIGVSKDSVTVSDRLPHLKRSRECYERVAPSHIPKVKVDISTEDCNEKISVVIPVDIAKKLPFLGDSLASRSDAESAAAKRKRRSRGNTVDLNLPGGPWGLMVVLGIILDPHYDLERALLAPSSPPLAAEALAV